MSNLGPFRSGPQPGLPTPPRGVSIAKYATYLEAQAAVDHLSDNRFPVQFVTIVGSGLRMVERVTGRLSYGRVAVAGALSGAWFGLFVGLLLSLLSDTAFAGVVGAMLLGAGFGMLFGIISYAATRGRRDFTSTSQIVASEYEVLCIEEHAGRAMQLLRSLRAGAGGGGSGGGGDGGGTAPATVAPAPPSAVGGTAPPVEPPPAAEQQPVPSGPTYGEMIDRKRAEEREREERERREAAAREAAARETAAAQETAARAQGEAQERAAREQAEQAAREQAAREPAREPAAPPAAEPAAPTEPLRPPDPDEGTTRTRPLQTPPADPPA
jgi:hypothetical protein